MMDGETAFQCGSKICRVSQLFLVNVNARGEASERLRCDDVDLFITVINVNCI
jgi:hypothetical protein